MSFELYSRKVKQAICTQCEKEFTTHHGASVCSEDCKKARCKARHERNKLEKASSKIKTRICDECKEEFIPSKGASRQIYCSKPCREKACQKKAKIKLDKERAEIKELKKLKTDNTINPLYTKRGKISHGVNHEQ